MKNPVLLVIDVQKGIDASAYWGGNRNNPHAEENIETLIHQWRERKFPVVFVKHDSVFHNSPFFPGQPGNEMKAICQPRSGDIISKSTGSAFIGTDLQKIITALGSSQLVIVGFVTNNSVESTARMAGDSGYVVTVVSDATAAFDKVALDGSKHSSETVHSLALANLKGEYASILNTKEVINLLPQ